MRKSKNSKITFFLLLVVAVLVIMFTYQNKRVSSLIDKTNTSFSTIKEDQGFNNEEQKSKADLKQNDLAESPFYKPQVINTIQAKGEVFSVKEGLEGRSSLNQFVFIKGNVYALNSQTEKLIRIDRNGDFHQIDAKGLMSVAEGSDGNLLKLFKKNKEYRLIDEYGDEYIFHADNKVMQYYGSTPSIELRDKRAFVEFINEYYEITPTGNVLKVPGIPMFNSDVYVSVDSHRRNIELKDKSGNYIHKIKINEDFDTLKKIHVDQEDNIYLEYDHFYESNISGEKIRSRAAIIKKYNEDGLIGSVVLDRDNKLNIEQDVYINTKGEIYFLQYDAREDRFNQLLVRSK